MGSNLTPEQAFVIAQQATIYGYPMVANYRTLYYSTLPPSGTSAPAFNVMVNQRELCGPEDTLVVTPNTDTLYSKAWVDLRAEPMVLTVPELADRRYYSFQVIDLFTNNVTYVGTRATGNGAGTFVFAGPDWDGGPVAGVPPWNVIQTPSQILFLLGRTGVNNDQDLERVHAIQDAYKLQPLSAFTGQSTSPTAPPLNLPVISPPSEGDIETLEFFTYLNFCLGLESAPPSDTNLLAIFAQIGVIPGAPFDPSQFSPEVREQLVAGIHAGYIQIRALTQSGKTQNGWWLPSTTAAYFGTTWGDYEFRAAVAYIGLYANTPAEAVYPMAHADTAGALLDASKQSYAIQFPAQGTPPAQFFWSVTMYSAATKLLVANPINRYSIGGDTRGLVYGSDGSLTINLKYVATAAEADGIPNLLPAPDGPFYVVLRIYGPRQAVLDSRYITPPVTGGT